MLRIRYIEAFCQVVSLGSITAAAEALFCVPSNITKMIKELESDLPAPLFTRDKGRLTVTTFGLNYYDEVSQLLTLAGIIEEKYRSDVNRTLRIGALDVAADYWLPKKIVAFQKAYPNFLLKVYRAFSRELETGLIESRYDVICSDGPIEHPEIESQPAFSTNLRKVGFASQNKHDVTYVYSFGHDCLYRMMIESWIKTRSTGRYQIVDIESYPVIRELVINGFGISFVPQNIITDLQFPKSVIDSEEIKTDSCFAWARFRKDIAIEQFLAFIRE